MASISQTYYCFECAVREADVRCVLQTEIDGARGCCLPDDLDRGSDEGDVLGVGKLDWIGESGGPDLGGGGGVG